MLKNVFVVSGSYSCRFFFNNPCYFISCRYRSPVIVSSGLAVCSIELRFPLTRTLLVFYHKNYHIHFDMIIFYFSLSFFEKYNLRSFSHRYGVNVKLELFASFLASRLANSSMILLYSYAIFLTE